MARTIAVFDSLALAVGVLYSTVHYNSSAPLFVTALQLAPTVQVLHCGNRT